ncbi:MAG: hypothetical protein WA741_25790 [Candidatus Sulfotelmatobacter sp.]
MSRSRRRRQNRQHDNGLGVHSDLGRQIPQTRWWAQRWAICVFLAALTAVAYAPVRGYPFITYDEPRLCRKQSARAVGSELGHIALVPNVHGANQLAPANLNCGGSDKIRLTEG